MISWGIVKKAEEKLNRRLSARALVAANDDKNGTAYWNPSR